MDDHKVPLEVIMIRLDSNEDHGLTDEEAAKRNKELGDNIMPEGKRTPGWMIFVKELFNYFSDLLWISAILSLISYFLDPTHAPGQLYLVYVLLIIIFGTAILSYHQNEKAQALMDSFKNLIPMECRVVRDGVQRQISAKKLVPGDLVDIKAGEQIPADLRILMSKDMKVDNSCLTGEAEPLLRKKECTQ